MKKKEMNFCAIKTIAKCAQNREQSKKANKEEKRNKEKGG